MNFKAVVAVVVFVWNVVPSAIGQYSDGTVAWVADFAEGEGVAIWISRFERAANRGVFWGSDADVIPQWRAIWIHQDRDIVHRRDIDIDRARYFTAVAVINQYGEAVFTVVVCIRGVGVRTIGLEDHRAMGWLTIQGVSQSIAVFVSGDHFARYCRIFWRDMAVVTRGWIKGLTWYFRIDWRWYVIDWRNVERHGIRCRIKCT